MADEYPVGSGGRYIKRHSADDPHVYDTSDPYVEDREGRGRWLVASMPLSFRRLIEIYRTLESQGRSKLAVLFVREHPQAVAPQEDDEIPADFVDDLSEFDDNPPAWIRRQQDKHLGLVVCYVDSTERDDWDIPSTALVFAVPWPEGKDEPERTAWRVRLPGVTSESPNRSGGCKVLGEMEAIGLIGELQTVLAGPIMD
ncbi:hypothetical protein FJY68_02350 [candidate division WOR-3 bacterium]|uniref:Uncharacterized protein n=1 Tax=candidate division WOR-3 bacterium TaxID=2052148 RepID=A0A937XC43_UNCW3|nr:hypothetical protein [candidate division WOR-3 bacterium]